MSVFYTFILYYSSLQKYTKLQLVHIKNVFVHIIHTLLFHINRLLLRRKSKGNKNVTQKLCSKKKKHFTSLTTFLNFLIPVRQLWFYTNTQMSFLLLTVLAFYFLMFCSKESVLGHTPPKTGKTNIKHRNTFPHLAYLFDISFFAVRRENRFRQLRQLKFYISLCKRMELKEVILPYSLMEIQI